LKKSNYPLSTDQRKKTLSSEKEDDRKSNAPSATKISKSQIRTALIEQQHSAEIQSLSLGHPHHSSLVPQQMASGHSKVAYRDKVARLRDIKKYLDSFFKELTDLRKEIKQAKILTINALA